MSSNVEIFKLEIRNDGDRVSVRLLDSRIPNYLLEFTQDGLPGYETHEAKKGLAIEAAGEISQRLISVYEFIHRRLK